MPFNFEYIIEGKLAGSAHPGHGEDLRDALAEWTIRHGVTALVTLTPDPLPQALIEEFGLRSFHLPVPDFGVPALESASEAVRFINDEIERGGCVVVHCAAGYGRTGLLLACCLVARGLRPQQAIATVRRRRPGSIETPEQHDFVLRWARWYSESTLRDQGPAEGGR